MKINFKQQFALAVSALIVSVALIHSLSTQVQSAGRQHSPSAAAGQKDDKRSALRDALRKTALKRIGTGRWSKSAAIDIGVDEIDIPPTSMSRGLFPLMNGPNVHDSETRVVVKISGLNSVVVSRSQALSLIATIQNKSCFRLAQEFSDHLTAD
ncbi:MAG TPA: hypothetical protein VGJ48_09655 [Pyrinomonadaceae bacterium]|nr:hypothetical protein [Pyrinomonadaceae bacterium]